MREGRASRTALRVALRRAAHQILDEVKVLDDPLAVPIAGEEAAQIDARKDVFQSKIGRSVRAFMAVRSRYAEDQLALAVAEGTTQYAILGAGLDTSAYRGLGASGKVRVFEVDHPATQAWKRERLAASGIRIPPTLTFVAVDFERHSLPEELRRAGFRANERAFVSWLGVVPYLTREAAARTFGYLGTFPAGSGVVFDYAVSRHSLSFLERLALDAISRRVARAGEPFQLFFAPEELTEFLRGFGFQKIEQLGATELNERYFRGRTDKLRVAGGVGRVVGAWT